MNKIINELLNTNARVIIPDFGAFIIKQKNPRLVVFNEFLRYNDGLLIDYIAASEGIEKSAAKVKVTNFVEEIGKKLTQGDEVIIEGLGTLKKDSTGKLTFSEPAAASKESQQKVKKPSAKKDVAAPPKVVTEQKKEAQKEEQTEKKEKPEPKKEEKIEEKKEEPKPKPEKEKTEEIKSKDKEEKPVEITLEKEETKPVPPKEEKKPREEKISVTPIKTSDEKRESGQARQTVPLGKKPVERTTRKNNSMQIIGWIILIVIVNGAIVAWFLFNDQITGIFKRDRFKETQMTTTIEADEEIPAEDQVYEPDEVTEIQDEDIVPEEIEQDDDVSDVAPVTQPVLRDKKQYYIVAGCFREENNADQLVIELREKGFQSEKFGKIGNLHAVSFSSFAEKSAALEELKKIRNTEQEEAWMTYY